ncbi:MAG: glutamate--tRNA ligase, partial [Clostridia bacterium]|nr:glutamate--tRNA ligase [Clostridia bacterium]
MTNNEKLAQLLFPHITKTPEDYEALYPPRELPEGARVTRFAPSPTGYLHMGGFFGALVDILTAQVSGGVSYLRIEDTDKKREVEDGVSAIVKGFDYFGTQFDEGVTGFGTEKGAYGPYTQSQRAEIYQTIAKSLVEKGLAYPCFCTADELTALREKQENDGALIKGYFGKYAKCRDLSFEEQEKRINAGESYVLRLRSMGDENKRIAFDDVIKGKIEMPENTIDEVLLKSDGIPTYHFAHACDDHFMRTTHVIRGEEWISSVPKHIELFRACGYKLPKYAHTPQV